MTVGVGGVAPRADQLSETSAPPEPPVAIADVRAAVDRFRQRPKSGRTQEDVACELIGLRQVCDLLELDFSETAATFASTDEYDRQASATPIDWIRHNCKMTGSVAAHRVCVGEQLPALVESAAAVGDGKIGFAHLSVIARTRDAFAQVGCADAFEEAELLEQAREKSVGRLWRFCQRLRHGIDAESFAREQRQMAELRRLRLVPCDDGTLIVRGWLDPIGGAAVRTALEPLARKDGQADDRDSERRMADALVELATHSLDAGLVPQTASQRPHLQVTTSLETLIGLGGSLGADMEFSAPVSSKTVQRLACDANVTRIVLGPDSAVIEAGRTRRVVSGATRRALNVRDQHCQWPLGCDRPASWTATHHVVHWTQGGPTNLANLTLMCHRHHWKIHEGGWRLARDPDGRLVAIPEDAGRPRAHSPLAREPDQVPAA